MTYGLFSDVHSNLEAFEAVLKSLAEDKVDQYVFLGDIVGYGADAGACIGLLKDLTRQRTCLCLAGNHDYAVCGLTPYENYSGSAREAIDWTKRQMTKEDMTFLSQLRLVEQIGDFSAVHANFVNPDRWGYVFDIDDAQINFKALLRPVGFIGHSHKPMIFTAGEIVKGPSCARPLARGTWPMPTHGQVLHQATGMPVASDAVDWIICEDVKIQQGVQYIINVGSVGQPRDGNPKASYVVYDSDEGVVKIKRIDYDLERAQEKIKKAGLPKILADRLALGK